MNDIYIDNKYKLEQNINNEADQYIFQKIKTYVYKYPLFIYKYGESSTLHQGAISRHDSSKKRIENMYAFSRKTGAVIPNEPENVIEEFTSYISGTCDAMQYYAYFFLFLLITSILIYILAIFELINVKIIKRIYT